MIGNLIFGCVAMTVCLSIQCAAVVGVLEVFLVFERRQQLRTTAILATLVLIVAMFVMFFGLLLQVSVWAGLFFACGEFDDFATAFYHSTVNFTTLGYGDLVMSDSRRLLGALEAANGMLMFGLMTGMLFLILSNLAQRKWNRRLGRDA